MLHKLQYVPRIIYTQNSKHNSIQNTNPCIVQQFTYIYLLFVSTYTHLLTFKSLFIGFYYVYSTIAMITLPLFRALKITKYKKKIRLVFSFFFLICFRVTTGGISLHPMIYRIENIIFMIGKVWCGLVRTNCYAMVVGLRKFSPQSYVVNAGIGCTEIRRKMQWQMMNRRELNGPMGNEINYNSNSSNRNSDTWTVNTYLSGYSRSPVGFWASSNSSSHFKETSSKDIFGRFLYLQIKSN